MPFILLQKLPKPEKEFNDALPAIEDSAPCKHNPIKMLSDEIQNSLAIS